MKIKTLIIEDEAHSQELLKSIVEEYCPELEILEIAGTLQTGLKAIQNLKPKIIFLDIQLGNESSFDILKEIDHQLYKVIFTTAYRDFAIEAFKYEAIDYVLKPYSPKSISQAVDRALKLLSIENHVAKTTNSNQQILQIPTSNGIKLINTNQIIKIEALGSYCKIYSNDDQLTVLSKNLKDVKQLIIDENFVRIHASHLINLKYAKQYIAEGNRGFIEMNDKTLVPISRRKKSEFLKRFKNFQGA